jgi:hypothetical protein
MSFHGPKPGMTAALPSPSLDPETNTRSTVSTMSHAARSMMKPIMVFVIISFAEETCPVFPPAVAILRPATAIMTAHTVAMIPMSQLRILLPSSTK